MSSQQRERELLLLGRLPDPLGRGEMLDYLVHVGDLDRAALGDVVAGPGLAGGRASAFRLCDPANGSCLIHAGGPSDSR